MQSKGRICNKHISIKHFWCSPHSRLSSHSSSFKNTLHTLHFRAKITCCLSCLTHQKFQFILPEQLLLTKANLCVWEGGGLFWTLTLCKRCCANSKMPTAISTLSHAQSLTVASSEIHIFRVKFPQTIWNAQSALCVSHRLMKSNCYNFIQWYSETF